MPGLRATAIKSEVGRLRFFYVRAKRGHGSCTINYLVVHRNTSFRWRHRFLDWLKHDRARCLQGIAELGVAFLPHSQKGQKGSRNPPRAPRIRGGAVGQGRQTRKRVAVFVARDRAGQTIDFIATPGKRSATALHQHLLPKIGRDVLLLSDSHGACRAFARQAGISHRGVSSRRNARVNNHIHLHEVIGYHARFRQWLAHFRGVATRYLGNYLGWRWAIDHGRIHSAEHVLRAALGTFNSGR